MTFLAVARAPLALVISLTATHSGAQTAAPATALAPVVITAEKRLTMLDKTPDAVSVISGPRLAEMGASGFQDLVGLVPNMSFSASGAQARLNIRGVGFNYGDPGVAFYVDGSYVSDQRASNTGLFDLRRVEVLRGPQGTLYGRNATGGAVLYISAGPTSTLQAQAAVLFGDYGRKETEGFVSGPLGEGATTARLSWQLKSLDGYTRNTIAGNTYPSVISGNPGTVGPDKLDDLGVQAFRLQTATEFGDAGNLRLIFTYYREDDNGPFFTILPQPALNSLYLFGVSPGTDRFLTSSNGQSRKIDANALQAIYE